MRSRSRGAIGVIASWTPVLLTAASVAALDGVAGAATGGADEAVEGLAAAVTAGLAEACVCVSGDGLEGGLASSGEVGLLVVSLLPEALVLPPEELVLLVPVAVVPVVAGVSDYVLVVPVAGAVVVSGPCFFACPHGSVKD